MKRCPTCNTENADAMQFCLQCGTSLANAPFVVNFQGGGAAPNQPTSPFGQSRETFPNAQSAFPNQFPNVPPPRPKSNSKMFLAIGGILALFLLLFAAGAAIFIYNYAIKDDEVVATNASTPLPSRTDDKSPSPSTSPRSSPNSSPTASPFVSDSSKTTNTGNARASYEKMWVDYNITEKGRLGMRIHTTFTVYNMKGKDSYLAISFQKKDGEKLLSNNNQYRSKTGQVAVYRELKPNYDETVYKDLQVFIPYDEFNLTRGKYDLQMNAFVIYENGDEVGFLKTYDFEYEKN